MERAKTCKRELGRIPNLFPVDFYDSGDIVEAVAKLNELSVGAGRGTGGSKQGSGADATKGAGKRAAARRVAAGGVRRAL